MNFNSINFRISIFSLFIFLIFSSTDLSAQLYHDELLSEGEYTFQEIVDKTEAFYDKVGRERGKGYKQFQRWKYWAERNMDATGHVRDNFRSLQTYTNFKETYQSASRFEGNYEELGPLATINTSTWSSALGRVTSIGLDPSDDDHIIVGSQTGGIWKTTDLGANWTPIYDFAALIDIYSLEISHANPGHYWAGLAGNMVRSTDGGVNWTDVSGEPSDTYNTIEMDPNDSNVLFAIAESSGRVIKSSDGGASFSTVMDHNSRMYDIEFHPTNPNIVYSAGNNALFKSTDGGDNFVEITNGPWAGNSINNTMMMAVTPAAPNSIYLLEETGGGFNAVYHSTDEGLTWTTLTDNSCNCQNMLGYDQNTGGGQAPRDMDIIVSPVDANIIHIAGVETWRSFNLGQNWSQTTEWNVPGASNFIHADIDLLIYDNDRIVAGTDGGIYYSTDEATSWTDITFGLGIRQFYRIGASQTEVDRVSGGSQDNGTGVLVDGNWYDWLGADGMETFIDWTDEDRIYGTSQFGELYRSQNGGQTRIGMSRPGGSGSWVTPFEQDPIDPSVIYTAREEIFKTSNNGGNWEQISSFNNGTLNELKIAPTNNDIIYAANGGTFYYTFNGGQTWNTNSFSGSINYITVNPFDPMRVSVAVSGSSGKVQESTDGGATWTNLTANLPSIGIECVYYETVGNGGLFCAGNPGVFYTTDTAAPDWEDNSHNLPNVRVTELEIRNQIMYVSTYGRGLWKFEFACDGSQAGMPCTDFDACTINDVFDENCDCVGVFGDSDNDGVCDGLDVCPGGDDNMDGDNDGIPDFCDGCAVDCPDSDCDSVCDADDVCPGGDDTSDVDGDGIPDLCDECDDLVGQPCDDGDPCTINDVYDIICNCAGELNDTDGDGVCNADDLCPGSDDNLDADGDGVPDDCDSCDNLTSEGVNLFLLLDNYPEETSWEIKNSEGTVIAFGGTYGNFPDGSLVIEQICDLGLGCFEFTIFDSYGDGICCGYGLGNYNLLDSDGNVLASGGEFNDSDSTDFCLDCSNDGGDLDGDGICLVDDCNDNDPNIGGPQEPGTSCDDNDESTENDVIQADGCSCAGTLIACFDNGGDNDGDGVCADEDCDDNDPAITSCELVCEEFDTESFETGFGIWNDGGDDVIRLDNAAAATTGSFSIMIRDDSDSNSSLYTNTLDLSSYETIEVGFNFIARSMEAGEDFHLEISTDGGTTYSIVKSWVSGTDFENLLPSSDAVAIEEVSLTNMTVVRFRCDASANNDQVFLDDISIQLCGEDPCLDFDESMIGAPCDDGDGCTSQDVYDINCSCVGVYTDDDNDGYCVGDDPNDNDPCIPEDCLTLECNEYDFESFEIDFGIWNSGGGDAIRINNAAAATTGSHSIMIRSNSGSSSSLFTNTLDLSSYEAVEISFHFVARSMETNEEFLLEISTDGGTTYSIIKSWVSGTDFDNLVPNSDIILTDGILLTNQTVIRFRCNASASNDQIFLDDITIQVCDNAVELASDASIGQISNTESVSDETELIETYETPQLNITPSLSKDILLIPNPVTDWMEIRGISGDDTLITIFSTQGNKVLQVQAQNNRINLSGLPNGMYLLSVWQDNQAIVKRFVKIE